MYDVIIVGKGPAGISASLYTARANLSTLIIARDFGSLEKADKIENYFGFAGPVDAKELLENGAANAIRLGVKIVNDEVVGILSEDDVFEVSTINNKYNSKSVILATGRTRKKAAIEGLSRLEGKGVSYCAVCDGFFYRGKAIAVLGNSDYALHEVNQLMRFTDNITLFTNGQKLTTKSTPPCKVQDKKIVRVRGEQNVEGIELEDGQVIPVNGIFVALGIAGSADFAKVLGAQVEKGSIVVDSGGRTGVEGLFAAGDCASNFLQISTAVGQGAMAAKSAIEYLTGKTILMQV